MEVLDMRWDEILTGRILRSVRTTSNYRYTVLYMLDLYRQDTEISPYNEQLQVYSTVHVGSIQAGYWDQSVQRATTGIQYSTCWICTVRILKSDRTTSNYRYTVLQCIFYIDKLVQGNLGIKNRILFIFVKYKVTHKGETSETNLRNKYCLFPYIHDSLQLLTYLLLC